MWRLLYNTLLILATPIILCILLAKKRCRRGFSRRFLGGDRQPGPNSPTIWIHAVSLGEVVAVTPLVKALQQRYPGHRLIVSTVTETGREAVEQRLAGVAEHRYAPLDLPWAVSRAIAQWRPVLYLFVETELWPNLLWSLRDRGVPAVLVNGRLSSRSFARQQMVGVASFYRSVIRSLALCVMQSDRDAQRIIALGADPACVYRAGNIKFDQPMPAPLEPSFRASLGVGAGEVLIVAGSTHGGEEEAVVNAYREVVRMCPSAVLMLAPRHLERVDAVVAAIQAAGLVVQRKSRGQGVGRGPRVIVLDTRGELARAYGEAAMAFVGGTLVPVGGHNLLEPAVWGKPVLFGPHTDHCAEIAGMLLDAGGGVRVTGFDELARQMGRWLTDASEGAKAGVAARRMVLENQGALQRSLELIERCLPPSTSSAGTGTRQVGEPALAGP